MRQSSNSPETDPLPVNFVEGRQTLRHVGHVSRWFCARYVLRGKRWGVGWGVGRDHGGPSGASNCITPRSQDGLCRDPGRQSRRHSDSGGAGASLNEETRHEYQSIRRRHRTTCRHVPFPRSVPTAGRGTGVCPGCGRRGAGCHCSYGGITTNGVNFAARELAEFFGRISGAHFMVADKPVPGYRTVLVGAPYKPGNPRLHDPVPQLHDFRAVLPLLQEVERPRRANSDTVQRPRRPQRTEALALRQAHVEPRCRCGHPDRHLLQGLFRPRRQARPRVHRHRRARASAPALDLVRLLRAGHLALPHRRGLRADLRRAWQGRRRGRAEPRVRRPLPPRASPRPLARHLALPGHARPRREDERQAPHAARNPTSRPPTARPRRLYSASPRGTSPVARACRAARIPTEPSSASSRPALPARRSKPGTIPPSPRSATRPSPRTAATGMSSAASASARRSTSTRPPATSASIRRGIPTASSAARRWRSPTAPSWATGMTAAGGSSASARAAG